MLRSVSVLGGLLPHFLRRVYIGMHMVSPDVLLGLTSSLAFGLLDVLISFASRFIGMVLSLVLAQAISVGILLLALIDAFTSGLSIQALPMLLLVGSGLGAINAFANLSLYKGLAVGPIALVSPISASYGLVTTSLAVLLFHEILSPLQGIAISLVLAGIFLSAVDSNRVTSTRPLQPYRRLVSLLLLAGGALAVGMVVFMGLSWMRVTRWLVLPTSLFVTTCAITFLGLVLLPTSGASIKQWWALNKWKHMGIVYALGSTIGFGLEFFGNSLVTEQLGPVQPLLWSRLCSLFILLVYAFCKQVRGWRDIKLQYLGVIALIGLLDTLGMFWYNLGTSLGATSIVATLSSTYMLLPMLVGVFLYRERLAPIQWSGVASLVVGVIILSIGGK